MGNLFDATDIVQFAVRIEENGANFYRFAVQITKDDDAKKIFEKLAEEEVKHGKTFSQIFAAMEKSPPPTELFEGEYGAYLRSYVDNAIIFKKEALDQELALVKDTVGALDFGIRRELDSITTTTRSSSSWEPETFDAGGQDHRRGAEALLHPHGPKAKFSK